MQSQLIGYLLNALEDEEARRIEEALATNEAVRRQLELLRFSLLPLGSAQHETPPRNLAARTCQRVRMMRRTQPPQGK